MRQWVGPLSPGTPHSGTLVHGSPVCSRDGWGTWPEALQEPGVVNEAMGTLVQAHFHGGAAR